MTREQIIALGGGGFSMEESPLLDDYILRATGKEEPRVCFVGTASGDSDNYVTRFYRRFNCGPARPTHLELFRRDDRDLTEFACAQDIIYVGGGNTANLLAIWKLHGFDDALRRAVASGTVLTGVSAGSICWFEDGVTDSFGNTLRPLECLGFLPGSNCPHYDGEVARRPAYHRFMAEGMKDGMAADDGVALHYVDGKLERIVSSREHASAYQVELRDGTVSETRVNPDWLGRDAR